MADIFSKQERSAVMSKIRGRGNRDTELRLATLMRRAGLKGWRRHLPLPGRPDFAFPREKVAIFVDGCFWHGCPKHCKRPASNAKFWRAKLAANVRRDSRANAALRRQGWRVMRVWEHDLEKRPAHCLTRIAAAMTSEHRSSSEAD
jgi:DNA mismatch endonuclease (patch repair protein)